MGIRVLSATDVRRALTARDAVRAMRTAFGELSGGTATVPVRSHLDTARGLLLVMPAVLGGMPALGAKVVSVFPDNPARGESTVQGATLLLDAETGRARALLDGAALTATRTAAGSALATELLASPGADVLAVFGAGAQGSSHVELLARTRRLREVRIVSRSGASAERLAARMTEVADTLVPDGGAGPPPIVRAVRGADEALEGAGLVVTATTSTRPLFDAHSLAPGAHVNAVGSYRPDMQEIDADVIRRARVVVDQRAAAWAEAGDLIVPFEAGRIGRDAVDAELGEIVNGQAPAGRASRDFTLFESVGNAAQDIAIAEAAVSRAEGDGLGVLVPF
ncbi:MAG: ornithine cyclodeaminase [Acidobacteria bacterium]|nr:ornithine cyclodeaminase [Acidobacteriota bacterium]